MSVIVTLAVPREEAQQSNAAAFYNDFGYAYGYGKGGAGFGGSPGGPVPFPGREMFGYSPPPGVYHRPPYDGWVPPPPAPMQGTPRSSRGGGPSPHDQQWNRHHSHSKEIQPAVYAGPQQGPSVVPPPLAYVYQRDGLAGQAASNQIASGLDALNLNQKNPELISAAWNAFFNTLSNGGASPQPHKQW